MEHVRNRMFQIQRDFLRIKPDIFYDSFNTEELAKEFERISNELPTTSGGAILKKFHRTRTLACWHDSSSISNSSHFMVMFNTLYDPAIFYTDEEYFLKTV